MKILRERDIRTFTKCSELYRFGGSVELPLKTMMLEYVYLKSTIDHLRLQNNFDFNFALNTNLQLATRALAIDELPPGEQDEIVRHAAIYMQEMYTLLRPRIYIPLFGPFEYNVNISKSLARLSVASILGTNDVHHGDGRVYHVVTFSPFSNQRDMTNDLVQRIKLLTLSMSNPFKTLKDKPRVKLHIFSSSGTKDVNYASIDYVPSLDKKLWTNYVEQPIKLLESGYHYPVVPCTYKCPYRAACNLDPIRGTK
jgi:hypothetical protein